MTDKQEKPTPKVDRIEQGYQPGSDGYQPRGIIKKGGYQPVEAAPANPPPPSAPSTPSKPAPKKSD